MNRRRRRGPRSPWVPSSARRRSSGRPCGTTSTRPTTFGTPSRRRSCGSRRPVSSTTTRLTRRRRKRSRTTRPHTMTERMPLVPALPVVPRPMTRPRPILATHERQRQRRLESPVLPLLLDRASRRVPSMLQSGVVVCSSTSANALARALPLQRRCSLAHRNAPCVVLPSCRSEGESTRALPLPAFMSESALSRKLDANRREVEVLPPPRPVMSPPAAPPRGPPGSQTIERHDQRVDPLANIRNLLAAGSTQPARCLAMLNASPASLIARSRVLHTQMSLFATAPCWQRRSWPRRSTHTRVTHIHTQPHINTTTQT